MEGFRRAGMPTSNETVLVMGVNGKVGQAATQIASWNGASVIGVVRKNEPYEGHANSRVEVIDASATDVATRVRDSRRQGYDIVSANTVEILWFPGGASIAGVAGAPDPDRHHRTKMSSSHLVNRSCYIILSAMMPRSAANGIARCAERIGPGFASGHLLPSALRPRGLSGTGQSRFPRGRRFVARSRHPAAGGKPPRVRSTNISRQSLTETKTTGFRFERGFYSLCAALHDSFILRLARRGRRCA